ncbi:E3 ubiquitin-protein ligase TRIM35-like isoform X2 [Hypomesus transpacificus]|uniref:E3 ubiquitin-protein ligase TRIM35-like isoform X2 n=1 Tax=Hypomesus transpacificus TaxID=137520 RepID=UPI001F07AD1A|nr:E3 ubiquitin-protein ligase TRIM35-like isoform X2 [Hypomesus transpacificus]
MQKAARMAALEEELEMKTCALKDRMNDLEDQRSALTQTISCMEELLNEQCSSFNQNIEVTLQRASDLNIQLEPETNTLLNVAEHIGNLGFHVWEAMKTLVKYTPVSLDPNTRTPWLILSKDLTCVRDRSTVKVPANPEKFQGPWVLGSEGFSRGSHSWDVAVPMEDWWVGVAPEAVSRYDPPRRGLGRSLQPLRRILLPPSWPGRRPARCPVDLQPPSDFRHGQRRALFFVFQTKTHTSTQSRTLSGKERTPF